MTISCAVAAFLTGAVVLADAPAPTVSVPTANSPRRPIRPKMLQQHAAPLIPAPEPNVETQRTGFGSVSPFVAANTTGGTTLTGPATLSYSGSSNALTITDSGTGRGLSASVTNANSGSSALFGSTAGTGAGLTGFNSGTGGPGGKFQVTNANSGEPGVYATTVGNGPAVLGASSAFNEPAVYGQNTNANYGVGVEGDGSENGVLGMTTTGNGVYGTATTGFGVYGATGGNNDGLSAGVYGYSNISYGVYGYATSGIGVYAYSQNNTALYAYSEGSDGYAAYFEGPTYVEGVLTANSYETASDKNIKEGFKPVDRQSILAKLSEVPVTSWDFKTDKKKLRHMGPMAQDFHAVFHLNGDDDKHINLGDLAGVTIAAVQELSNQMKDKDARIVELKGQLVAQQNAMAAMADAFSARMTAFEQRQNVVTQTAALRSQ